MFHEEIAPGPRERRFVFVALFLSVALAVAALVLAANPAAASTPAPGKTTARYEVAYMKFVIDHHAQGIKMGKLCVKKAKSKDLRDLCANIVATQRQESKQLQGWLSDWYGVDYEPQMKPGDARMLKRLASLRGYEFDAAMSKAFIRHHKQIITKSQVAMARVYHEPLRELATDIVRVQSAEIGDFSAIIMRAKLCQAGLCG